MSKQKKRVVFRRVRGRIIPMRVDPLTYVEGGVGLAATGGYLATRRKLKKIKTAAPNVVSLKAHRLKNLKGVFKYVAIGMLPLMAIDYMISKQGQYREKILRRQKLRKKK